jgi:hypothetical protein
MLIMFDKPPLNHTLIHGLTVQTLLWHTAFKFIGVCALEHTPKHFPLDNLSDCLAVCHCAGMFRTTKSSLHFCFIPELISHTDCLSRENDFKTSVVKGVYIKKLHSKNHISQNRTFVEKRAATSQYFNTTHAVGGGNSSL